MGVALQRGAPGGLARGRFPVVARPGGSLIVVGAGGTRSASGLGGLEVLLVEDEPTIAVTLGDDLSDAGFRVTYTPDGSVALAMLATRTFDAVVTDLRLPGADGFAVLRTARRMPTPPPVLVMSAYAALRGDQALAEGASAVLGKPFCNSAVVRWLQGIAARTGHGVPVREVR